jgi:hypothetical protein
MLKELLNKDDEADNSNKDSKNNTITTNKKLNKMQLKKSGVHQQF